MAGRGKASGDVALAVAAARPATRIAFWPELRPSTPGTWVELAKDAASLANSGGGVILFGVARDGSLTGWNPEHLLQVGMARIHRELDAYVGGALGLDVGPGRRQGRKVATMRVAASRGAPIVFEKDGSYVDRAGREHTPFRRGMVYFRHGPRSGPATAKDLARFAANEERRTRRDILEHLRQVAKAPTGSEVIVVPPASAAPGSVERFRVVDDPAAPVLARTDFDVTHPYRQKELVEVLNRQAGRQIATAFDVQCVRRVHRTDTRADFFHRPKFGSPQYSESYLAWLLAQWQRDPQFFEKAKAADRGSSAAAG
ncbi:MAG: helix-turn-helix domain-containing protein [Acidimicrobiales bacterium]